MIGSSGSKPAKEIVAPTSDVTVEPGTDAQNEAVPVGHSSQQA